MKKMKNFDDENENKWISKFTRGFQRQIQTGIRKNQQSWRHFIWSYPVWEAKKKKESIKVTTAYGTYVILLNRPLYTLWKS